MCTVMTRAVKMCSQVWVEFCTIYEKNGRSNPWTIFGGLVLDCITTVSSVQSVIAECSLYYCGQYNYKKE